MWQFSESEHRSLRRNFRCQQRHTAVVRGELVRKSTVFISRALRPIAPVTAMARPLATTNACLHMRLAGPCANRVLPFSVSLRQWPCRQASLAVQIQVHVQFAHTRGAHTARGEAQRIVHSRSRPLPPPMTIAIQTWQVRRQSTSPRGDRPGTEGSGSGSGGHGPRGRPPPPPPHGRVPIFRLLLRALGGSLRSLFTPFQGQTLRTLYRSNPEELVLALAV